MPDPAAIPLQLPCPKCGYLADPTAGLVNFCPKCGRDRRPAAPEEDTASHALAGQVIAERYRLLAPLGEGGMGAVYKAEHIRMGKTLALKLLRGSFAADPGAVGRFRAEAQIVSRLSHPHTIAVFDFGELAEGGFYLAMEYVPGKDLATVLSEQKTLPVARAATIAEQLLGSLGEAHDAGIVHRDIKPANVMLMATRSGEDFVKVLDFGIAKLRDAPGASTSETSAGAIIGTPNYLSPEQARGDPLDARADLYSVGALLYELVSGRCPFVAPNPMAVVSAHLTQKPPPLRSVAPGISETFAAIVHRALEKKPEARFASADEMRAALLRLGESSSGDLARVQLERQTTGELQIASRQDFADLERQIACLKRNRVMAPASILAILLLAGLAVWRWPDLYGFLRNRAPVATEGLPAALRPAGFYDGQEHEPNHSPAQANPLPLPPGTDGQPFGGVTEITGTIGARMSDSSGDVDVFVIAVPKTARPLALHVEWCGENPGEGVPGLDVALTLNRDRGGDAAHRSAPLMASVDRGGSGRPEGLVAAVGPGTYYLAVREKHPEGSVPVEKPRSRYHLKVWLAVPQPGEEIEPNDQSDSVEGRVVRYPEWKELAERNPLGEGRVIRGTTSPEDPDTYSIAPRGAVDAPELVAVVPDPGLALTARLWVPDAEDLGSPKTRDRVAFKDAGEAGSGEVLFLRLVTPQADAPVLLQLRGASGEGRYDAAVLGQSSSSGPAVLALLQTLEKDGRAPQALELAAGFARILPRSTARDDVLLSAGKLADRMAPSAQLTGDPAVVRASRLLGDAVFEKAADGHLRYAGAFEAQVRIGGDGRSAEEASWRLISRATPCTAADVAQRASFFLARFDKSEHASEARLWLARAQEEEFRLTGSREALRRAGESYRMLIADPGNVGAESRRRLKALDVRRPVRSPVSRLHCK